VFVRGGITEKGGYGRLRETGENEKVQVGGREREGKRGKAREEGSSE
jgi:hypothetical protein